MAITKTLQLANGLIAPDAYIRIDSIYGSRATLTYSVNCYVSRHAFTGTQTEAAQPFLEQELLSMVPDVAPDALPLWDQLYTDLKSRERYADATDCWHSGPPAEFKVSAEPYGPPEPKYVL